MTFSGYGNNRFALHGELKVICFPATVAALRPIERSLTAAEICDCFVDCGPKQLTIMYHRGKYA